MPNIQKFVGEVKDITLNDLMHLGDSFPELMGDLYKAWVPEGDEHRVDQTRIGTLYVEKNPESNNLELVVRLRF